MYICSSSVATMKFNQTAYRVLENDTQLQVTLVLTNVSSTNVTVQVYSDKITAVG